VFGSHCLQAWFRRDQHPVTRPECEMKWLELAIQLATLAQLFLKVIKELFGFPPGR
jgi:hypothetical protein